MTHLNPFVANTMRIFPPQGRYGKFRYDMNENPEGLPKDFVDSVLKEITPEFLAIYPEPDRFLAKYAAFLGITPENCVCTNGSDQAIRYLLEAFGERGKEVVTVSPSFEMYRVNCALLGYKHIPVTYEPDMTFRIEKLLASITENTRIVVLINPNNPIGNTYSDEAFRVIQQKAETVGALVIVDEAYHYFYAKTFLPQALQCQNVVILRTFSKLMSLAACRLGIVIGPAELVTAVRTLRLTFDVNSIALLFAERLIEHPEIIETLIATQQEGKSWLLAELQTRGYWCRDCIGNFVFIKPRCDVTLVVKRLEEHNVLVHPYEIPLLKDYIRVSTGSKQAMSHFLEAFLLSDK